MLLVETDDDLRPLVSQVLDQAVVQAAVARAGVEGDVRDLERAQHLGDGVAHPFQSHVRLQPAVIIEPFMAQIVGGFLLHQLGRWEVLGLDLETYAERIRSARR